METSCSLCPYKPHAESHLTECSLKELDENHIIVKFNKGDSIIKQGTYSTNIIFLRKGLVKIHIAGPYSEQIVKLSKAPNYLGLPTTFGARVNHYSITAIAECEICFIDVDVFRKLLKENELFMSEIIQSLCRYELESFQRCANRTQKLIRGNLADVLIDFSNNIFSSENFTLPISQTELGNLIDTSRESVSRILNEFEKDGIIRIHGKNIEITNKKSLINISQKG